MAPARRWRSADRPLLPCVLVLVFALVAGSYSSIVAADNQKCCPNDAHKADCENSSYHAKGHENDPYYLGVEAMARCFGITGAGCQGIPDEDMLMKLTPKGLYPLVRNNNDGTADGVVTIGSILHDLCCMRYPYGEFCNLYNRPVLTFNWKSSDCACTDEWRTAVYELFNGYAWRARVPYEVGVPPPGLKMDDDASHSRTAYMRTSFGSFAPKPVRHTGLNENVATKVLQAPDGTRISCPDVVAECKVQCNSNDEKAGLCKSSLGTTTRYFKQKGIKAGNSEFCASGLFVEITRSLVHSYGVCGTPSDPAVQKSVQDRIQSKKNEILNTGATAADKAAVKKYYDTIKNMAYTGDLAPDTPNPLETAAKQAKASGKPDEQIDSSFLSQAKTWLQSVGQKALNLGRSAVNAVASWFKL